MPGSGGVRGADPLDLADPGRELVLERRVLAAAGFAAQILPDLPGPRQASAMADLQGLLHEGAAELTIAEARREHRGPL